MTTTQHPNFLRIVLLIDAATCLAMGLLLTLGTGALASLTQLSVGLLFHAGVILFPIAAFIAFVGTRDDLPPIGVWLVILGNAGWVAGSLWLLLGGAIGANALGHAFLAAQAAAVAILAGLEYGGLRRMSLSPS